MYKIDEALKTIYKNDMFPLTANIAPKELEIKFPDLNLTIGIDQFAVDKGDFELHESICMDDQLKFGKCNASSVKFTLADVTDDIKGKEFNITQTVIAGEEASYIMPLGFFTVYSAPKQDDLRFKDITAYNRMKNIDVDVAAWYNSLAFPLPLSAFRASFLDHVGLTEDISKLPLPNDTMSVEKTIEPSQLSGRVVIEACEEINGCFGLMGRDGKFTHIILKPMFHDYPQSDYPESDYPEAEPYDEYLDNYQGIHFEEYRVQPIDKLQIRQEENDVGCIYGTGTNVYIIQGNFLVYGKSAEELQTIAANASTNIFDRGYRPYTATGIGLPYIMPGDFIKYNADDTTAGYVFERTLTSIQVLQDEYGAKGSENQEQNFDANNQFIQQQGRMTKIEKSVDSVKVVVSDLDKKVSGEIDVLAGQVVLKVDTNGKIGYVELDADPNAELTSIKIKADNISLEGLVTANGNFKVNPDGSIETVNGKFSGELNAATFTGGSININNKFTVDENGALTAVDGNFSGDITASNISGGVMDGTTINGAVINGGQFNSFNSYGTLNIEGPYIMGWDAQGNNNLNIGYDGSADFGSNVQCRTLNGYEPITRGNIAYQSVLHSENADSADFLNNCITANSAYLTPILNGITGCGSSYNKWSAVFSTTGSIVTSDKNKKNTINELDERYLQFARMLVPKSYKMNDGTSGRTHLGFIAQEVEEAMTACGLSDLEFAGLCKDPIYAKKLTDKDGNKLQEYDTTSDLTGYDYSLRYDEFIPILLARIISQEERIKDLEDKAVH